MRTALTARRYLACLLLAAALPGYSAAPAAEDNAPRFEFIYEAHIDISPPENVGETVLGHQRIIPITGGTFEGPKLRGKIIPGAADWNLQRSDGVSVVSAAYFMQTDDGVYIKIVNQGVNASAADNPRPRFTSPSFEAPKGKYEWLNQAVFIGTLVPKSPRQVVIRVYRLV